MWEKYPGLSKILGKKKYNGYVYLLHFESKLHHAAHYIGFAFPETGVEKRLEVHRSGQGAKLLRALNEKGIQYWVARTWDEVDRNFERKLKNQKNSWRFCPICSAERRKEKPVADQELDQKIAAQADQDVLVELAQQDFDGIMQVIDTLQKEEHE
jgi:predicted GIY-YIG superfamily endonuclease